MQADLTFRLPPRVWAERYYIEGPIERVRDTLMRLIDARMRVLCPPAVLFEARAFDATDPRHPIAMRPGRVGAFRLYPYTMGPKLDVIEADNPDLCAVMQWRTDSGARRALWLGGIPLRTPLVVQETWPPPSLIPFMEALDVFRDALLSNDLRFVMRELSPLADAPSAHVDGLGVDGKGLYRLITREDFPAVGRMQVRFLGSRGNNLGRARGVRRIVNVEGPRAFSIDRGPLPERGAIRYTGGATVNAVRYRFAPALWEPFSAGDDTPVKWKPIRALPGLTIKQLALWQYGFVGRLRGQGSFQRRGRSYVRK